MKQNAQSRRFNEIAREKLAQILIFEVSDPELEFVTVTACKVSVDKSYICAFISCEPERYESVLSALARAKGRLRSLLGRALGWRLTPELAFQIDASADEAEKIDRALKNRPPSMRESTTDDEDEK